MEKQLFKKIYSYALIIKSSYKSTVIKNNIALKQEMCNEHYKVLHLMGKSKRRTYPFRKVSLPMLVKVRKIQVL